MKTISLVIAALALISVHLFDPAFFPGMIPGTDAYAAKEAQKVLADALAVNEAAAAKARKASEDQRYRRNAEAQIACQKAVKARVKFPTKASFDPGFLNIASVGPLRRDPSMTGVRGRVELMNGFGAMIPHIYGCDIKDGHVLRVSLQPG